MSLVVEEIGNSRFVRQLLSWVDVRKPLNGWLDRNPRTGRSKSGKTRWIVDDLSSFWVSQEIFRRGEYDPAITASPVGTFVDLGTNVGYFACRVAEFNPASQLRGLCLEANPGLLPKIQRNLTLNALSGVKVVNGLAGAVTAENAAGTMADFHVSAAHTCSSASGTLRPDMAHKADDVVQVPAWDVFKLWNEHFSGQAIDLLKVDIEGCEENLVFQEPELMAASSRVVMEIHHWLVDEKKILARMKDYGFSEPRDLFRGKWWSLVFWERS